MSVNILPGSLTVTGNVSTATAGIGGNLVVGGNITVTGNLYSANVTASGGGGGGGVSSITTVSGITSSGSTGAITISAVVANVVGVSGIGANNVGGTVRVSISGALSNDSSTSNNIGGVEFSNSNIYGTLTGIVSNGIGGNNNIGGVNINSGRISNAYYTSNNIGGVTVVNSTITTGSGGYRLSNTAGAGGRLNLFPANVSNDAGPKGLLEMTGDSNGINTGFFNSSATGSEYVNIYAGNTPLMTICGAGVINTYTNRISNDSSTSNNIGGVILSNNNITNTGTFSNSNGVRISTSENRGNIILQFHDANHLILTTSEQGGVTMPVIQAGQPYSQLKFFNSIGTEVGGINLNTSGGLSNLSNSINNIGGVQLSNGEISNASTTSNNIGGVQLSNTNIITTGRITSGTATSNNIGGVDLSNTNIITTGRITSGTATSNNIGGVSLSAGAISNDSSTSNNIGGVVLSNGIITPSNVLASSNGYIRLGPVLYQWGYDQTGTNDPTIAFPLAFSGIPYTVLTTPVSNSPTTSAVSDVTGSNFIIRNSGLEWTYWFAVGPA